MMAATVKIARAGPGPRDLTICVLALSGALAACGPAQEQEAPGGGVVIDAGADVGEQNLTSLELHHVGLNVVDPDVSLAWWANVWPHGEATTVGGMPAFGSEMYLIFNRVDAPAPGGWNFDAHRSMPQSAFWHIGLNTDTTPLVERFDALGVTRVPMYTSLDDPTEIWRSGESDYPGMLTMAQMAVQEPRGPSAGGFGYFIGPDGELVEASGRPGIPDTNNHIHFYHEQPWCAVKWYIDHLGMTPPTRRHPETGEHIALEVPDPCAVELGDPTWPSLEQQGTLRDPRATVRFANGSWSAYTRQCRFGRCGDDQPLVPSRGQVLDHVGFTIENLDGQIERLRSEGVTILEEIQPFGDTRGAMIADLDGLAIHLIER